MWLAPDWAETFTGEEPSGGAMGTGNTQAQCHSQGQLSTEPAHHQT